MTSSHSTKRAGFLSHATQLNFALNSVNRRMKIVICLIWPTGNLRDGRILHGNKSLKNGIPTSHLAPKTLFFFFYSIYKEFVPAGQFDFLRFEVFERLKKRIVHVRLSARSSTVKIRWALLPRSHSLGKHLRLPWLESSPKGLYRDSTIDRNERAIQISPCSRVPTKTAKPLR